jgi:photosystem II stability/assembly factor-like uncharacterized protein
MAIGMEDTSGGTVAVATANGGAAWSQVSLPEKVEDLWGVSCPAVSQCVLLASVGTSTELLSTTNGGASWASSTVPGDFNPSAVSCPSTTECIVVGEGAIAVTQNLGNSWMLATIPADAYEMSSVSCPSVDQCFAVGYAEPGQGSEPLILVSNNAGLSWEYQHAPASMTQGSELTDISCASVASCVAVSGPDENESQSDFIIETTDGGSTWTLESVPSGVSNVARVSCGSTLDCVAVGEVADFYTPGFLTSTDGGVDWTVDAAPSDLTLLTAIDCPFELQCTALGTVGDYGAEVLGDLHVTSGVLPSATVGEPYRQLMTALGGRTPYQWSVTAGSLPAGLTLKVSSGAITGVPTTSGVSVVVITVTDADGETADWPLWMETEAGS